MGTRHDLSFCACRTVCLVSESPASMGPRPHLWVLIAKQRLLDQHTNLYGYQTSPVVLCMQNCVISSTITRLYGFQPSPVIFCMQNSMPSIRIISLYGSQPSSVVFACKTETFGPNNKSLWVPEITCRFVHAIQID